MNIQIIIGSTRPGRVSERIAKWVYNEVKKIPEFKPEIVDLAYYNMPLLDEPISPQYNPDRKPNEPAARFLSKTGEADGFILVTPEYNRSYSAVLKNALDYIDFQMKQKPVALVAHGSTGGAQAVSHLRAVIPGLYSITIPSATFLVGRVGSYIDEQGNLSEEMKSNPMGPEFALNRTLEELKWYSEVLKNGRNTI